MSSQFSMVAVLCCAALLSVGQAADTSWVSVADGDWHSSENWSQGIPNQPGDLAQFGDAPNVDSTLTIGQPTSLGQIEYTASANTIISGTGSLILDNNLATASIQNSRRTTGYLGVNVPIVLASDLEVRNDSRANRIDLNGGITSVEGVTSNLTLRSASNEGFELLGGITIGGDLHVVNSRHTFFGGPIAFNDLVLDRSTANFESSFVANRVELNEGSQLFLELPATVNELLLGGGVVEGPGELTVRDATIVTAGDIDFSHSGELYGTKLVKEGSEQLTLVNLGNDLQHDIDVREGTLSLNYPDVFAVKPGTGPGKIRLTSPTSRLVIPASPEASLSYAIDLNNVRPNGVNDTALNGVATLTGPLHLGDQAANISGGFHLRGPISGGSAIMSGEMRLLSGGHTFTGDLVIDRFGRLYMDDEARLESPNSVLLSNGDLYLAPGAQRIDTSVPVVIDQGKVIIQASDTEFLQQLGNVVVRGRGVIAPDDDVKFQDLSVADDASFVVFHDSNANVLVDTIQETDLLPTNIRRGNDLTKYDPEQGIVRFDGVLTLDVDDWKQGTDAGVSGASMLAAPTSVRTLSFVGENSRLEIAEGASLNVTSGGIRYDGGQLAGSGRFTAGGSEASFLNLISDDLLHLVVNISDNGGTDGDFATLEDNAQVGLLVDGRVRVAGNNSFSGPTIVTQGALSYQNQESISPYSSVEVRQNAGLEVLFESTANFGSVLLDGGTITGVASQIQVADLTIHNGFSNLPLTGDSHIVKTTAGDGSIEIDSGFSGTVRVDEGLLRLRLFEPFDGPFGDNQGTIEVSEGAALQLDSEAANAAFQGTGTINHLSFHRAGGSLRPGNQDSIGTLNVGQVQVRQDVTYQWQLGDAMGTAGQDWDLLNLEGLFIADESKLLVKIEGNSGDVGDSGLPTNFDRRQVYSWQLAAISNPNAFDFSVASLEVDDSFFESLNLLPNGFSFAKTEGGLSLEYGRAADINDDLLVNGDDLDAACSQGLDLPRLLTEQIGTIAGDTDLNGNVEFADFLTLAGNFGGDGGWSEGDTNCDQEINFADFLLLSGNFGASAKPIAASVPEPRGNAIAILILLTCCGRKPFRQ